MITAKYFYEDQCLSESSITALESCNFGFQNCIMISPTQYEIVSNGFQNCIMINPTQYKLVNNGFRNCITVDATQYRIVNKIKEGYLVLFCCLAAGADYSKAYIDVKDAQWVCKGDLVPTDVNSLGPSHFVIYRFGVFLIRLLHHRSVQAAVPANQGIVALWKVLKSLTLWEIRDEQIHCPMCIVLGNW